MLAVLVSIGPPVGSERLSGGCCFVYAVNTVFSGEYDESAWFRFDEGVCYAEVSVSFDEEDGV